MSELELTEAQAEHLARTVRCRKALAAAPEVAMRLRAALTPADGRTEGGILREQRTPLLTGVTDAADELLVILQSWADDFAGQLGVEAPRAVAWRNGQTAHASTGYTDAEPLGFRAGTTPEAASLQVSKVSAWLLWHETDIEPLAGVEAFQDEIATLIATLRFAAGMTTPRRPSPIVDGYSTRRCPRCRQAEVRAEFFGEPVVYAEARGDRTDDFLAAVNQIAIRCANCGWRADAHPAQIGRWLAGSFRGSRGPSVDRDRRDALILDEWWTLADAAFVLGVSKPTLSRWVKAGLEHRDGVDETGQRRLFVLAAAARERRWPDTPARRVLDRSCNTP